MRYAMLQPSHNNCCARSTVMLASAGLTNPSPMAALANIMFRTAISERLILPSPMARSSRLLISWLIMEHFQLS